jgi:preprotein translocase subunit YajC
MSLSSLLGIATSHAAPAATTAAQHQGSASMFSPLIIMVLIVVAMYFLMIRPQSRKRKEHQRVVNDLGVGDDIVTIGGIVGRISKLKDDFIVVMVSKETELTMQRSCIANVLPKGTFEE